MESVGNAVAGQLVRTIGIIASRVPLSVNLAVEQSHAGHFVTDLMPATAKSTFIITHPRADSPRLLSEKGVVALKPGKPDAMAQALLTMLKIGHPPRTANELIMPQSPATNRRIVLSSRPHGAPVPDNFRLETTELPAPADGQLLLRTVYLSLDPYMRGRMSDAPSYVPPVEVGEVMVGGAVCRVEQSLHPDFVSGDWVLANTGWQDYALSSGEGLIPLGQQLKHPSLSLGVLGMPGFTAYMGLLDIGQPQPGETVVVAAATGAVGSAVGQIAKLKGCRVVAVAGGPKKCKAGVDTFGFDLCLDHYAPNFDRQLANACTKGIDVYFESVGGKVFDAVLPLLNVKARIPVCGLIAHYNDTDLPEGPDRLPLLMQTFLVRRIKAQGFIIYDYYSRYGEFLADMTPWVAEGKVKYIEDVVDGLEHAPDAFIGLLEGKNFGKLVVRVGEESQ
jgi:NADPH-dependent curcumin reductase CurA